MNHTEALRLTSPSPKTCRAILLPDAGMSALSEDYFRSTHHLRAEQVTHTLVIEDGEGRALRVPLLVRPIEGTPYQDAISPYGFPGGRLDGLSEVSKDAVDWTGIGLVSLFVRDRVSGPRCFVGGTERNEVFFIDSRRPLEFQAEARRQMRRNTRLGYVSTCGPARAASHEERADFKDVYRQTMVRDEAHARYFFSDAYFEDLFSSPVAWLVTTRAPDGRIASSGVAVASDGVLHYYLGGTADAHLSRSPTKNTVFESMVELSVRLGLPLHLGGGVRPGDGLEQFKRSFANASSRLHTHEVICDPSVYARLSAGRGDTGFFPAYRAPRG
ncbi:GNAT family N-acetyltransferase [Corallococcus sp. AB004]|uniref:GNAT family N-acetyltransferase n=1 Tax=Corallococcus TaxID=83461 RepID=UPI000EA003FA|nr:MULTISPECIES: GNAT family N-acetyltransferase [Corallococcus]NPC73735.1 GNAT family N-acetyltransferase [Corallococcus exiguus]NPD27882.1 GNAT family N-acetyltransferase [Corallococcus exiguus]RKI05390.1 GNAT family N-acetyltransferase [Corallococcus sp. AB038B]RKI36760.1 GNAT family N-acetyltransferase [Corallococcus sp. AB004]